MKNEFPQFSESVPVYLYRPSGPLNLDFMAGSSCCEYLKHADILNTVRPNNGAPNLKDFDIALISGTMGVKDFPH